METQESLQPSDELHSPEASGQSDYDISSDHDESSKSIVSCGESYDSCDVDSDFSEQTR